MPVTDVDIANMALGLLDEAPIDSLEDNHKAARLVNLHYELTREAELSKWAWVFAISRAELEGTDIESGDGTLTYEYELPADCLRLLPLTLNGEPDGLGISWRQEEGHFYSDHSGPLKVRYIANLTDPNDWTALFTEVLVAALASKIAHALTNKGSMIEGAQAAYDRAVKRALRTNALERGGALHVSSWLSARGAFRSGYGARSFHGAGGWWR